jgi:hypothetical protein
MQKSAQPPKSPSRSQRDGFEPLADKAHKSEPFWMAALGNPAATPACKRPIRSADPRLPRMKAQARGAYSGP